MCGWQPHGLARFRAVQGTIRSFAHPNIAAWLGGGFTAAGLPYFATDQVDGLPVTEYGEAAGWSLPERLRRLFLPVCEAVAYAHRKGIFHGGLKPANLLCALTATMWWQSSWCPCRAPRSCWPREQAYSAGGTRAATIRSEHYRVGW